MKLFVEPNDILMFRDGKPFSGGADHYAKGVFPPLPSTFYGALRSHILSNHWPEFDSYGAGDARTPEAVKAEVGSPDGPGSLTVVQFGLGRMIADNTGCERLFPMPRDVVRAKGNGSGPLAVLKPESLSGSGISTDMPYALLFPWRRSEEVLEDAPGFLPTKEMEKYLQGDTPDRSIEPKDLYEREERTGIMKNRVSRSVEGGRLYGVEYFRLNSEVGFCLQVEGTNLLPPSGILRLGGDNRSACYAPASWKDIANDAIRTKVGETGRFKLVLLTPAVFGQGWIPQDIDATTMEGRINGVRVKLVTACLGRPVAAGGFDIVRRAPKPMQKAVPAGSVYYCDIQKTDVDRLFESIWLRSVSNGRAREGFGISLIGGW